MASSARPVADRDLDLDAEHASRRRVVDGDDAARRLPHDDAAVREPSTTWNGERPTR